MILQHMGKYLVLIYYIKNSISQPATERQIPHVLTYMWNLKQSKLIEAESRLVITRSWENGEKMVKGYEASVRQEEYGFVLFFWFL
jgi:hypothetical protein